MKGVIFYKLPIILFSNGKYKGISTDTKILYSLLWYNSLSIKNGWIDNCGRYYQYFTIKECKEKLNFGYDKIIKLFKELESNGLILRKGLTIIMVTQQFEQCIRHQNYDILLIL